VTGVALVSIVVSACGPGPTSPSPSNASPITAPASPAPSPSAASPAASPAIATPGPSGTTASFDPTGIVPVVSRVVGGLSSPLDVLDPGDGSGRLFVAEQAGRIRIVEDGALVQRPFLDIRARISSGGERGLLGIAVHPGYPTDSRIFVDYTDLNGNTVVSSFRVSADDPDTADPDSETVILRVQQPFANHNGGGTVFGPDGMLYVALGDGGSGGDPQGNGQRLDTLLAKILRIDVDHPAGGRGYGIPPDNPFVGASGARPEIWLTGLRNPFRFRFDRGTGDLWIGDVGQGSWEEIDVARAGQKGLNYGWNRMEGFHCFQPQQPCDQSGLTLPVAEYGHDLGCAVIGGVVARGAAAGRLQGGYVFGDDCSDNLWLMSPVGDQRREPDIVLKMGRTLSSINEAADGTIYATSLSPGELLRIDPPAS
jgi:glucose/arabinose dehydrogenase